MREYAWKKGRLSIVDCGFFDNENGILAGGDAESTLEIQNSEFGNNGHGDGQSHNLYVGAIAMLKVTGSYFHHARVGHLLKSRAAQNLIYYNRLTDETGAGQVTNWSFRLEALPMSLVTSFSKAQLQKTPTLFHLAQKVTATRKIACIWSITLLWT